MSDSEGVGCAKCGRAVYKKDVDDKGLCVLCRPATSAKKNDDDGKANAANTESK